MASDLRVGDELSLEENGPLALLHEDDPGAPCEWPERAMPSSPIVGICDHTADDDAPALSCLLAVAVLAS